MPRRIVIIFTIFILAFTVIGVQAQGKSGECHGNNPNCAVDSGDDVPVNENTGNGHTNGNPGNGHTNDNPGNGHNNDSNPVDTPPADNNDNSNIPPGSGCPGLENAFSNTEAGNSNYDVLLDQLYRHGCFVDLDGDGVDDRVDLCLGGDDNIDVDNDGIPDDCDDLIDSDGDGYGDDEDCEPFDPAINPGAEDIPDNGIDEDCDGEDATAGLGRGDISFTLSWAGFDDYDLHVIDPAGDEIWYAVRTVPSGGTLDADALAACNGTPGNAVENIFWPTGSAPAGTYQVRVDLWSNCDGVVEAWTLEIRVDGIVVESYTGSGSSAVYTYELPG